MHTVFLQKYSLLTSTIQIIQCHLPLTPPQNSRDHPKLHGRDGLFLIVGPVVCSPNITFMAVTTKFSFCLIASNYFKKFWGFCWCSLALLQAGCFCSVGTKMAFFFFPLPALPCSPFLFKCLLIVHSQTATPLFQRRPRLSRDACGGQCSWQRAHKSDLYLIHRTTGFLFFISLYSAAWHYQIFGYLFITRYWFIVLSSSSDRSTAKSVQTCARYTTKVSLRTKTHRVFIHSGAVYFWTLV